MGFDVDEEGVKEDQNRWLLFLFMECDSVAWRGEIGSNCCGIGL
jgi:hypothetical protein